MQRPLSFQRQSATTSVLVRYGFAVLAAILALALTLLLWPLIRPTTFLLFAAAVLVSAWVGGLGPGLLTTALAAVATVYFFFPPVYSLAVGVDGLLRLSVWVLVAVLISVLTDRRKQAEAAERAQREYFQVTLASIGDAVMMTDPVGTVTFLNRVAEEITGWTTAAAMGKPLPEVFHIVNEETRHSVENPADKVLRTGAVVGLANHTVLIRRDGSECPIDESAAPIRDAQGQVLGIVLVFRDISARRQVEQSLQESRDQLAVILRGVADGITAQTSAGQLIHANEAAARILGYPSVSALLHAPLREVIQQFEVLDEEGHPFPLLQLPGQRALRGEQSPEALVRFRIVATGEERWSQVKATPIMDEQGRVRFAVNIFRDITALKRAEEVLRQSEARYRTVSELVSDYAYAVRIEPDGRGVLEWITEAFSRITGFTMHELDAQEGLTWLIHPEDMPSVQHRLQALFAGQPGNSEHRILTKSGEVRWLQDYSTPEWDPTHSRIVRIIGAGQDITVRKQAEKALAQQTVALQRSEEAERAQREFFQVTLTSIGDAVIVTNPQGEVTFLNRVAEVVTGWVTAEAAGKPLPEVFHIQSEETRQPVENPVAKVLRTGGIAGLANHTVLIRKDGSVCPIDDTAAPIRDERGRLLGIVLVFRDISARRQVERALQESETRLQAIVTTAVDGIITIDERGSLEWLNPAAERLFGYAAPAILGQNVKLLMPEPYREEHDGYLANYLRTGEAKVIGIGREVVGQRRDGTTFPLELAVSEVRLPDQRLFTGIVRDITARKQAEDALRKSEARFRALANAVPAMVWTAAPNGAITYASEQWLRYCGITPEQNAGQWPTLVLHPDDQDRCLTQWAQALERGIDYEIEVRNRRVDGEYRWFLTRAVPARDATGRITAWYGTTTDIHDRKRLEETLVQQAAELRQFAHIVSHDLGEPLRTVTNYIQLLARRYQGKLDTRADEYIAFAVDGAQRMQQMITDLLAYTRAGGQALRVAPVDCETLLVRVLSDLRQAVQESAATITHDPLPTVHGDATQLGLVFQNLIGNALKFRGTALPRIHVSAHHESQHWRFAVQDNGIGLDSRHAERIFQVFQRLHTRSEYAGTGIGLAICKKIVERHGGRIWVDSQLGQGATFNFTIRENSNEQDTHNKHSMSSDEYVGEDGNQSAYDKGATRTGSSGNGRP